MTKWRRDGDVRVRESLNGARARALLPERSRQAGSPVRPGAAGLIIGRAEGSEILLGDPRVSHRHALVRRRGDQVIIEDLRSTNGTMVNGTGISFPTALAPGDVVTVGDVQLRLESG